MSADQLKALMASLSNMKTSGERVFFLRLNHPVLYCKLLRDTRKEGDKSTMNYFKNLRNSVECYTFHILNYLEPILFEARVCGSLRTTKKKKITIHGYKCKYRGDVDMNGNAHGAGTATDIECGYKFCGTFVNNQLEGICKYSTHHI